MHRVEVSEMSAGMKALKPEIIEPDEVTRIYTQIETVYVYGNLRNICTTGNFRKCFCNIIK